MCKYIAQTFDKANEIKQNMMKILYFIRKIVKLPYKWYSTVSKPRIYTQFDFFQTWPIVTLPKLFLLVRV